MHEVTAEEQQRLERLLRKHRKRLLAYPNVHSVDVGLEFSDGRPTGRLALRVHVTEKVAEAALSRAHRVPDELDGVPVDVIQFNPRPQQNRNQRHDPVMGGVQIMNTSRTGVGTLGMIVLGRGNLEPLGLSNHHVMVRTPAVASDLISQPGTPAAADILGTVAAWNKALDCAVCRLGARAWTFEIFGVGPASGTSSARIGMKVMKSGLSSGVTWGIIDGVASADFTVVPDTSVPSIGEMSLPGDSGSVWLELATNRVVGLHFAGESPTDPNERAKAKRIQAVLDKLDVMVFTGAAIGSAWIGGSCRVTARTRPLARCFLAVIYPSGRRSSAKGLGAKVADGNGWVEWTWRIGTHTKRAGAGTGAPLGRPLTAVLTLDGVGSQLQQVLEGTTRTD
ncbi:MAG: hypothetical protein H0T48_08320 [Gemmatimonadaceae bacterium]|nr:hypothetical protein [Gemmatimonadaceae bacterium]